MLPLGGAPLVLALLVVPAPPVAAAAPTLIVAGLERAVPGEAWRDLRLGMGLRGRLTELFAASGHFELREEKELVAGIEEAVSGIWVREPGAATGEEDESLRALQVKADATWLAVGSLAEVAVTRDRVTGVVGGRSWTYRAKVRLCLRSAAGLELCRDGQGRSTTRFASVAFSYRDDGGLAFDQAGPAQAVDRALGAAFEALLVAARPSLGAGDTGAPAVARGEATEPLTVYVAAFGLRPAVVEEWPALAEAAVGLGLANRIADAVWVTRRFRLLEEKAEVVARLGEQLARTPQTIGDNLPDAAAFLLYGEIVEVLVRQEEKVLGLADRSRTVTTTIVELRVVDRASGRVVSATGRGEATGPVSRKIAMIDPAAVADATGRAVEDATRALLERLER